METVLPWLALKSVPGIGNHLFKRLIDRFGSPDRVFRADRDSLLGVEGVSARLATAIRGYTVPDRIRKEIELAAGKGFRILPLTDPAYPPLLLEIPDPPPILYVYGELGKATAVAVVGSRNATPYGLTITRRLCGDLATRGMTIVSGMARGIDTAAHMGALSAGGNTIAVLGSGLLRVYPAENVNLFHRISENGAVISEFPLHAEPEAFNFPARNRVISGIALGTIVVEATRKSGSLITARLAAEQGREVFAVPGSIQSFKSTGTHTLIKAGAKLVENAQDVLDELTPMIEPSLRPSFDRKTPDDRPMDLSEDEARVLQSLGAYPVHIDDLVRTTGIEPGRLSGILLSLEMEGRVTQAPGKLFTRTEVS